MNIPKLKVMPCPIWAGRHPYHEHRFIATPAPAPDRLTDALEALQECVDLLRISEVRFKICDGGKGNLGGASSYHRAMKKAHAVLHPRR